MRTHPWYIAAVLILAPGLLRAQESTFALKGTITGEDGMPLYEAQVAVFSPGDDASLLAYAYTDSSGQYTLSFATGVSTGVDVPDAGQGFALGQAYPNPVPTAQARLHIPYSQPDHVTTPPELQLFDALGRRVLPGEALAAGVYFYRVQFAGGPLSAVRRFVFEGGRLSVALERIEGRANLFRAAKTARSVFLMAVAHPGYYEHREEVVLEAGTENTLDATLVPVQIFGQATIGPDGGTLADTTGRVILDVPPGALAAATEIVVRSAVDTTGNPWLFKGTIIDLEPDGLVFASPATLTFHYDSLAVPYGASGASFAILTEDSTGWQPLEGEVTDSTPGTLSGPISHFSRKAAGLRHPPAGLGHFLGYKSSAIIDYPIAHSFVEINLYNDGGEGDQKFEESIVDHKSLPPWRSMPECFFETIVDTEELDSLYEYSQHSYSYPFSAGDRPTKIEIDGTLSTTSGAIIVGDTYSYLEYSATAQCPPIEKQDTSVVTDGFSRLYLGDINPELPEARRAQIIIGNPDEIPVDIKIRQTGSAKYSRFDGVIQLSNAGYTFNHGLQRCSENYHSIRYYTEPVTNAPIPPDLIQVEDKIEALYSDIITPLLAIWYGVDVIATCKSIYNHKTGSSKANNSSANVIVEIWIKPTARRGCSGNCR